MFVEPFAGSAALTLSLISDARFALVPYQGSKWRHRKRLREIIRPDISGGIWLNDPGPWGNTWAVILSDFPALVGAFADLVNAGSNAETWRRIVAEPVPQDPIRRAAAHLFLQRLSAAGCAIGILGDHWKHHGMSATDAFGKAATGSFGAIQPQAPTMLRRLRAMSLAAPVARASALDAADIVPPRGSTVYADPPYCGRKRYSGADPDRCAVLDMVDRWTRAGCDVWVSEAEPLCPESYVVADGGAHMGRRRSPEYLSHFPPRGDQCGDS